ncbi:MAG: hypothetical protein AAF587_42710 [Bacteroidota bacterium]
MKYTIITTVGTSLLTNYQNSFLSKERDIRPELEALQQLTARQYKAHDRRVRRLKAHLSQSWFAGIRKKGPHWEPMDNAAYQNTNASAEISSLIAMHWELMRQDEQAEIDIQLLATDTGSSVLAAELIQQWFNQPAIQDRYGMFGPVQFDPSQDFVPLLRIEQPDSWDSDKQGEFYDRGLQNLVNRIMGKDGYVTTSRSEIKKGRRRFLLNFSGGYKAMIPILTILGQIEEIPLYYIYDDSDYLMEFGNLPVQFDHRVIEQFYPYYLSRSSFSFKKIDKQEQKDLERLCKTYKLFSKRDTHYQRSFLGDFFFDYIERHHPHSKNVLGYFMEYKFYEYRLTHPYKDFTEVEHSVEMGGREFDLILRNPEGKTVIIEIKSASAILNAYHLYPGQRKNLSMQVEEQLLKLIEMDRLPDEYHLYFYFYEQRPHNMNKYTKHLQQLRQRIHELTAGKTQVGATYAELHLSLNKASKAFNPYQKLSNKFTPKQVKELVWQDSNPTTGSQS